VTITPGDVTKTLGANTKLFKGQIILSGGCTVAEAAQYLQYVCREASTTTINGADGWRYRALDASYDPNAAAPFGAVAGGKWFVAQGWWLEGVLAGDSQNYQLTSHDGTVMTAPIAATIEIGNLTAGDRVLAGRDNGSGGFLTNEYTLAGATTSGGNTCVVVEPIKADTPLTGPIRVNGIRYNYTGYNAGTKTFTISVCVPIGSVGKDARENPPHVSIGSDMRRSIFAQTVTAPIGIDIMSATPRGK